MSTAITTAPAARMMDKETFDHMARVGKVLAMSPLFPKHLREGGSEQAIANGILVLNMADRLREDPLTVSQNIYFVGGKPGWSTSYMIAKANQHGVFKHPIDWEVTGDGDSLSVTAFAELSSTGRRVEVTCDMKMAKSEGWTSNKKYQSMPQQMLRYRSAAFLIRLYCPEVMVGVPAAVEHELEMKDVTPDDIPQQGNAAKSAPVAETGAVEEIADAVEVKTPEQEKKPAKKAEKPVEQATMFEDRPARERKKPEDDPLARFKSLAHMVSGDLLDGEIDIDTILKGYDERLSECKDKAPEIYAAIMQEVQDYRDAAEG